MEFSGVRPSWKWPVLQMFKLFTNWTPSLICYVQKLQRRRLLFVKGKAESSSTQTWTYQSNKATVPSVCPSGRKFCHLMLLALRNTHGEGRHHKKCLSTCCSAVWGAFEPHLQFFGLADCDVCVCVCGPSASPHKQVGFPATDIEFPSLITHYRLH